MVDQHRRGWVWSGLVSLDQDQISWAILGASAGWTEVVNFQPLMDGQKGAAQAGNTGEQDLRLRAIASGSQSSKGCQKCPLCMARCPLWNSSIRIPLGKEADAGWRQRRKPPKSTLVEALELSIIFRSTVF